MPGAEATDDAAVVRGRAAYRAVGLAEHDAMTAQKSAVAAGASTAELEGFTAETLGAAGCEEYLDAMRLLSWRAHELSRALALIDVGGPRGSDDAMMYPIVATAAALAALVEACLIIRDPTSENTARDDAAAAWRDAIVALSELMTSGQAG